MPDRTGSASPSKPLLLRDGASSDQGVSIENLSCDDQHISQKTLRQAKLESVGLKRAELTDCSFIHTRFTDCYFKDASLTRVRFIDCFFDHCNFDGAVFSNCGFEYSDFRNTRITYSQIENCFPESWQNVLFRLARSLRMNAQSIGDYDEYRQFLALELKASEKHYRYVFSKYDGYYKKYRWVDRVRAFFKWKTMWIDRLVWGHGERWTRVPYTSAAVVTLYALLFRYKSMISNMPESASFWSYLAFSASNFVTLSYGSVAPANDLARCLLISEAGLGLIFFGLLVTSLYVRISKR